MCVYFIYILCQWFCQCLICLLYVSYIKSILYTVYYIKTVHFTLYLITYTLIMCTHECVYIFLRDNLLFP